MATSPLPTNPARWFHPRRNGLVKARAAIRSTSDFASFVGAWASDRRRFMVHGGIVACSHCNGTGQGMNFDPVDCIVCDTSGNRRAITLAPSPGTLDDCLAVAADLPGITKAEDLVLEAMRRLGSWRVPQWERHVVWVTLPEALDGAKRDDVPGTKSPYVTMFDEWMLAQAGFGAGSSEVEDRFAAGDFVKRNTNDAIRAASGHLSGVAYVLERTLATAHFAKRLRQPGRKRRPHEPEALEDPFEPLGALLDLGYVLGGWSDVHIEMWMPTLALVA